jgi:hypothetical protein
MKCNVVIAIGTVAYNPIAIGVELINNGARVAILRLVRPSRNRPVCGYSDKFYGLVIVPSAIIAIGLDVGLNDVAIAAAMGSYVARDVDG